MIYAAPEAAPPRKSPCPPRAAAVTSPHEALKQRPAGINAVRRKHMPPLRPRTSGDSEVVKSERDVTQRCSQAAIVLRGGGGGGAGL